MGATNIQILKTTNTPQGIEMIHLRNIDIIKTPTLVKPNIEAFSHSDQGQLRGFCNRLNTSYHTAQTITSSWAEMLKQVQLIKERLNIKFKYL